MFHGKKLTKPYEFKKQEPTKFSEFYWYQEDLQGHIWMHISPTLGQAQDVRQKYMNEGVSKRISIIKHRHNFAKEPARVIGVKPDALILTIFDHPNTYIVSQRDV